MPKFTLKCEHPDYDEFTGDVIGTRATTTVEFKAEDLKEVISEFEMFLRGCGYMFEGNLDFFDYETQLKNSYFVDENVKFEKYTLPKTNEKVCNVCGISRHIMMNHQCFDENCPKGHWNEHVNLASEK